MAEAEAATEVGFEAQTEDNAEAEVKTTHSAPAAAIPQSGDEAGAGVNPSNISVTSGFKGEYDPPSNPHPSWWSVKTFLGPVEKN